MMMPQRTSRRVTQEGCGIPHPGFLFQLRVGGIVQCRTFHLAFHDAAFEGRPT